MTRTTPPWDRRWRRPSLKELMLKAKDPKEAVTRGVTRLLSSRLPLDKWPTPELIAYAKDAAK